MKRFKYLILVFFVFVSSLQAQNRISDLQNQIDSAIIKLNCEVSVLIVSATKYDVLYEHLAGTKMIPASITKVVTSATALAKLGTNYEFKTAVYTDAGNIDNGIIKGNVYLKGYGDPDLSSSDISNLAKQVTEMNIREITGNIIFDDSFLDEKHYGLANYYESDTKATYWPYVSAINLDKNKGKFEPASAAAALLLKNITESGIKFNGIIIAGVTPEQCKKIAVVTRKISDVIVRMNKESDNMSAITLYKVIGAETSSPPGSLDKGSQAVINFLTSIGVDRGSYEFLEGSGLTRFNMVTGDLYIPLLKYLFDHEDLFYVFYNSLPVAGVDGTLNKRMAGTEAQYNVHAKTGTINNVSALTGYAITRDNEMLIFYINMNGFTDNKTTYRDKQDKICEIICRFSRN